MDLTDPTRAITPTLDGPILAVLASAGRPLTVGEIAAEVPRGSEIGVRKAVARLVDQGTVTATQMGRNLVHELNREHIAAQAAEALATLRGELWKRIREALAGWTLKPVYASLLGQPPVAMVDRRVTSTFCWYIRTSPATNVHLIANGLLGTAQRGCLGHGFAGSIGY